MKKIAIVDPAEVGKTTLVNNLSSTSKAIDVEKITIVGPPGAGKTTLANNLSYSGKTIHLDRLFWDSNWKRKTRDSRIDILQNLVQEQRWIIEGTYINSTKLHLDEADTIVFLDTHPLICLLRIIKRHLLGRRRARRDIPMGSSDRLTVLSILKVILFPIRGRIKLEKNLRKYPPEKVVRLHSAKEVEDFLAYPEHYFSEKRESVKIPTCV